MHKTLKNMFFGAMAAAVVGGAFTATARQAHAAEVCDVCPLGDGSGWLIATGHNDDTECVAETDPQYIAQCKINS